MRKLFLIASIFFLIGMIYSCQKDNEYPIEPEIEFSELRYTEGVSDSVDVIINFTDGDGDIGFGEGDTVAPFNNDPSNYYYSNYYLEYFENVDGVWQPFEPNVVGATNPVGYRIPYLTPLGQNKSLKGEILVGITISPVLPDSFYVEIVLIDRALHISNTVESNVIYR